MENSNCGKFGFEQNNVKTCIKYGIDASEVVWTFYINLISVKIREKVLYKNIK